MTHITENEEKALDNNETISITRGSCTFKIPKNKVYAYGEIDFNKGSDDYNTLADMNWFDRMELHGVDILSRYNYKHNTALSDRKGGRWYDTTRPELVCQFKHGQLGKPKRTIIFKTS